MKPTLDFESPGRDIFSRVRFSVFLLEFNDNTLVCYLAAELLFKYRFNLPVVCGR